jgi:hypothetical protein
MVLALASTISSGRTSLDGRASMGVLLARVAREASVANRASSVGAFTRLGSKLVSVGY